MIRRCLVFAVLFVTVTEIKGLNKKANKSRVYGGVSLRFELHKFLVIVSHDRGGRCSGSIVNHYRILTAAHCFNGHSKEYKILHRIKQKFLTIAKVAEDGIVKHPEYDPKINNRRVDLAVMKTLRSITFDEFTQPIPLARSGIQLADKAIIAGFGRADPDGTSTGREGNIIITQCPEMFEGVICTLDYVRAASGDSGGALVHNGNLAGVISASCSKAENLILSHPCLTIFANVTANIEWIEDKIHIEDTTAADESTTLASLGEKTIKDKKHKKPLDKEQHKKGSKTKLKVKRLKKHKKHSSREGLYDIQSAEMTSSLPITVITLDTEKI